VISLRQKQKKLIMLPSETMIWQPEFTDKTLARKTGAVQDHQVFVEVLVSVSVVGVAAVTAHRDAAQLAHKVIF
ncbi:hypothetical protein AML51_22505, partial [Escherichia coli]